MNRRHGQAGADAVVASRWAASARGVPLDHGQDRGPHADEHDAAQQQEQAGGEELPAADRSAHDGEFADERAERGRAGDGQEPGQEHGPDSGTRWMAPRTSSVSLLP